MGRNGNLRVNKRRVVITGLGVVSPCGVGKDEFWKNILCGNSFIDRITSFPTQSFRTRIGGEIKNFDASEYLSENDTRRFDEVAQYAFAAAKQAIADSRLDLEKVTSDRVGVIVGSCHGAVKTLERDILAIHEGGLHKISPFAMANASTNIAAGLIALKFGLKGPNFSVVSACASGTQCVGEAYDKIAMGRADVMLAGGAEAAITPFIFAGYCFISAMSARNDEPKRACRPFDAARDGFVMSEGAGMLVLEELNHARQRNAHIYAEIVGYGAANDAAHVTNLSRTGVGIRKAMQNAIEDAGVVLEDVDYINTHGSATVLADKCEGAAIVDLFKYRTKDLLINSTKSITGHMMGASGAVEAIVCALSIENGIVHPTLNYEFPDPECGVKCVVNRCVEREIDCALSNSIGFGGAVSSILLKKYCGE